MELIQRQTWSSIGSLLFLHFIVLQGRMVTSSLTSNNVSSDVYPINDKKKLKSAKAQSSSENLQFKIPNNKSKENLAKNKNLIIESKNLNLNKSTKSEECGGKADPVTITTYLELNNFVKTSVCGNYEENQENCESTKASNLKEVGKILQEVLWKAPLQKR